VFAIVAPVFCEGRCCFESGLAVVLTRGTTLTAFPFVVGFEEGNFSFTFALVEDGDTSTMSSSEDSGAPSSAGFVAALGLPGVDRAMTATCVSSITIMGTSEHEEQEVNDEYSTEIKERAPDPARAVRF
jgi:hypothetical protein